MPNRYDRLIQFLQDELCLSNSSIALALKHSQLDPGPLPMVLWRYGLITLEQLDRIYEKGIGAVGSGFQVLSPGDRGHRRGGNISV